MQNNLYLPTPSEKQKLFLGDDHKYVIFGGSRGGGKSFAVREKAILLCLAYNRYRAMIIRRTYPELKANHIDPLCEMLGIGMDKAVARYNKSDKEITFKNGSKIVFGYCDNENALHRFQGQQVDALFIDEATQIPEEWLKKLYTIVRGVNGYPKRIYLTCNPGGVSHGYIRRLLERRFAEGEDGNDFNFIRSSVYDNHVLMAENPDYIKQLEALPQALKEAWLYGRWDIFEGAYFQEFRISPDIELCEKHGIPTDLALREHRFTHVIEPFEIPKDWRVYRSYDFGYGKPFSCAWTAVDYEDTAYRFLELYGCTKEPNTGVRWTPNEQFKRIKEIEDTHPMLKGRVIQGVADPSIWDGSRGVAVIEEAEKLGLWFDKGINDRIPGWLQVRERMKFDENGYAKLYFFNNCEAIIRCMPLMMYDKNRVEDLDSSLEDHCLDDLRYFCMSRPIAPRLSVEEYKPMSDPLEMFSKHSDNRYNQFYESIRRY